jgi:hypothetical protein
VSKVLADAISKGISSSSDSKKSGFSNNVEERLKLLGSFTGMSDDREDGNSFSKKKTKRQQQESSKMQ